MLASLNQLAAAVCFRAHNSCNMKKVDKNLVGFVQEGHAFKEVIPFTDIKGKERRREEGRGKEKNKRKRKV